ncbi:helix-turn-helix domain-containing protein [Catellatospora sp. KI3]|uniref:PucR family transcriptional regulator n=1 Tax=Catellatospora sp. KI3 TaxID=3041620 RepID=UPI0024822037|nr:helix-turn-helix domain-containing protein [Catellatospora sp. KI3]MDI1460764.1 helix-turn-helix domain-containing protein [Catellatospora sp. KI3]
MTQRPRASLGRVLGDLGDTLLELLHGDPDHHGEIGGVVIDDPTDEPVFPPQALVLGLGIEAAHLPEVIARVAGRGAVGLVVRSAAIDDELRRTIDRTGIALIGLRRGATWTQLIALLRSVLAEDDVAVTAQESLGGLPSGDLFAVANAVAALLDAPVTIEDRSSRVLAFSGRQEEADPSRVETVIGRQVPDRYARLLTEAGVFRDLYRQRGPVIVDPRALGHESLTKQRIAIAVRAGDEILGSIWAVMDGDITPQRSKALSEAANLVALHLLRIRAGADVQRRLQTDLVSTALEGGPAARDALARLGLSGKPVLVVAAALPTEYERDSERAAAQQRLADAMSVHLTATAQQAAVAPVGRTVYALLHTPRRPGDPEERTMRILNEFADRVGDKLPLVAAIGTVASAVSELVQSRAVADRVLRVLVDGPATQRVARLDDVQTQSLMLELRDIAAARGERPGGALAKLLDYDLDGESGLVESLRAWLDALGDVTAAANALFIHPNTLRYRLRRITEVSGLDLSDPDQRFAAMLQLRILNYGQPRSGDS